MRPRLLTHATLIALLAVGALNSFSNAAPVSWAVDADGLWQIGANWTSAPSLPGATDQVTVDRPGALTVTLSSGSQSVQSLSMKENLAIAGGAELLVGSGGGQIDGALTITGGRLTSQAGGTLTLNGAVNSGAAGLRALSGATLNATGLVSVSGPGAPATYDANGAGSRLDLSNVTTFSGGAQTIPTNVVALTGGRVELDNVATLTSGATFVIANGAGSVVDLTSLTHFSSDNPFSPGQLQAIGGGTLVTPNLATVGRASIEVRDPASSINLAALTSANGATFRVLAGGDVTAPALASYAAGVGATEFFVSGSGSSLDLSNVATMSGATLNSMVISSGNNATIDLSGLSAITGGAVNLVASTGSVIDLSNLASYNATNPLQVRRLRADSGGKVLLRAAGTTTVAGARVEVDATGMIIGQTLELGVGATLAANGTLDANLTNTAGVVAVGGAPGRTTVDGDFQQAADGVVQVEVGGTTAVSQFDQLVVTGAAQLGGTIHVTKLAGFTPTAGQSFQVLTAMGGVTGEFNVTWSGSTPWTAVYDGNSVTLKAALTADFDEDLDVDADDLDAWKAGFGQTAGAEYGEGDADADGDVDGADFLAWQRQVGATIAPAAAAATSVPEPGAAWLLGAAALAGLGRRRRAA